MHQKKGCQKQGTLSSKQINQNTNPKILLKNIVSYLKITYYRYYMHALFELESGHQDVELKV